MRKAPVRDDGGEIIGWAWLHADGTATIQLDGSEAGRRIARDLTGEPAEEGSPGVSGVGLGPGVTNDRSRCNRRAAILIALEDRMSNVSAPRIGPHQDADGRGVVEHDGASDYQVCGDCGYTWGAGSHVECFSSWSDAAREGDECSKCAGPMGVWEVVLAKEGR